MSLRILRFFKTLLHSILSGKSRSAIIKKNIAGSFIVKGLGLVVSLALVPLTIHLLDHQKYGIWMTIFSIVSWFNLMDIGVGSGFRNKFAEAVAEGSIGLAREYVKTLYSSILVIAVAFFVLFSVINPFLNWYGILNLPHDFNENITLIIWVVFGLFCLQLLTKNIAIILLSLQKTTLSNFLVFLGNFLALIIIFTLQLIDAVSLFSVAIAFMVAPVLVFAIYTVIAFHGMLKEFRPDWQLVPESKYLNDFMGLGLKFFVIQVAAIFMYGTGNLIITQLQGPAEVTPYTVAFRLFSSAQVIFSIIVTPFWSAFTEANTKADGLWIRNSLKRLLQVWFIFSVASAILWIFSPVIFRLWIGSDIVIPLSLSLQFCIFIILNTLSSVFITFLSGIGKISILFYCTILQCILYIPLAIFLATGLDLGSVGVILSLNINLLLTLVAIAYQSRLHLQNRARGFWSK